MEDDSDRGGNVSPLSAQAPCMLVKSGASQEDMTVNDVIRMEPTLKVSASGPVVVVFTRDPNLGWFLDRQERRNELRAKAVQFLSPEHFIDMLHQLKRAGVSDVVTYPRPHCAIPEPIDTIIKRFQSGSD